MTTDKKNSKLAEEVVETKTVNKGDEKMGKNTKKAQDTKKANDTKKAQDAKKRKADADKKAKAKLEKSVADAPKKEKESKPTGKEVVAVSESAVSTNEEEVKAPESNVENLVVPADKLEEKASNQVKEEEKVKTSPILEDEQSDFDFKIERTTQIKRSKEEITIKRLTKMKDKLRFDLALQRNDAWSLEQKSDLIHSIIYGYPIPQVMVQESDDEFLWLLDGKQRLTTILDYCNGEFALSKKTPSALGEKIAGCKFADLAVDLRDYIYDESITFVLIKSLTNPERDELFLRWNSGTPLTKIELTRAMHSDMLSQLDEISDLEFFIDVFPMSTKARNSFIDQEMILQIAMLMDKENHTFKGFGSKQIQQYVLNLKSLGKIIPEKIVKEMEEASKYLSMALGGFNLVDRRQILKKLHTPIIFLTAIKAKESGVSPKMYGDFIDNFFITNYRVESNYGKSCQAGSPKKENVEIRIREMDKALDGFIKAIQQYPKNEVKAVEKFSETHKKEIDAQVNSRPE